MSESKNNIFRQTVERRGQMPENIRPVADLKMPIQPLIEVDVKEAVIKAREVVLEQERLLEMLRNKFEYLSNRKKFDEYCDKIQITEGTKEDFWLAIPRILQALNKDPDEFLKTELCLENFDTLLYAELKNTLAASLEPNQFNDFIKQIINLEIDSAVSLLDANRRAPVLAHRVRGFGLGDESAEFSLTDSLNQRVAEIEFDIRSSYDGHAIIHHNATLGASANRPEAIKNLTEQELAKIELKHGDHIVSLRKFFEILKESKNKSTKINIDIKDFDEKMLDEILDLIHEHKLEHRVTIVSWFPQALQYLYEKDSTLPYSLSYFPAIRGISRWVIEKISQLPSGSLLFGKLGTWLAKKRAEAIQLGNPEVQSTGSEHITGALILNADEHWTDTQKKAREKGTDLRGKHTLAYADMPISSDHEWSTMARVLRNGGVNIMAFEEAMSSLIDKFAILKKFKKQILNVFKRMSSVGEFAKACMSNQMKVNLYDLKTESDVLAFIESMDNHGVKDKGVVYSSNPDLVKRLDIRKRDKD